MSLSVTDTPERVTAPRQVDTVIIGSGFAGLGAAIKLTQKGKKNFLVLERGGDVGGTWRDNTYPGAACDVPSHLYSYSFALNPDWTRSFSTQPEIQNYITTVARKYNVMDKHVFNSDVTSVTWNEDTHRWDIVASTGEYTAKVVVTAVGALCEPNLPPIAGIESFQGDVFHSAQWNHDVSLEGKRVAVIGTGASAIQIVPAIAGKVEHLDVYQRTAPWILPRFDREYTKIEKLAFKYIPGFQRLSRTGIYAARETQVVGLAKNPKLMKLLEVMARKQIMTGIKDKSLRKKVTPNFRIGCKRMLISNNYYPALDRPNVDLVTDGIAEVRADSIVSADGTERKIDSLIVATGFHVTDSPAYHGIFGRGGKSLAQTFDEEGQQGYKGAAVANFPNMFFLVGPNTGLGHTSMVFMIESQLNYVVDALDTIEKHDIGVIEVRKDVQDDYNADLQDRMANSVWMNGGCASWYLDKHGNNTTLWPDFTFRFRNMTKKFDLAAYRSVAASDLPTSGSSAADSDSKVVAQ